MGRFKEKVTDNDYKIDTYYGIETTVPVDRMVVSKTPPIIDLSKEKLTLMALKLFDIYLGRINPTDSRITKVVFTKDDLCKVLGTEKINNKHLLQCLDGLMNAKISIACSGDGKSQIEKFHLLSYAKLTYENEYYMGVPTVELECSEAAKAYIYNLETVGFLKANLSTLLSFESKNAYFLYQYIKQTADRRQYSSNPNIRNNLKWTVDIDTLKMCLGIADKYKDVKDFEKWVLLPSLKEIEEKTDLRYTYKKIRVGRRSKMIEFQVFKFGYEVVLKDNKPKGIPEHAYYDEETDEWDLPFN